MNITVDMYSKTTGLCLGVLGLDPRDYLEYETMEDVEDAIKENIQIPEYADMDEDIEASDIEIDIPDSFWREWEDFKNA